MFFPLSISISEKSFLEFLYYFLLFLGCVVFLREMCPLRFILVFFSAVLAGYFAWRTVSSSPKIELASGDSTVEEKSSHKKEDFNFKTMIQNGFWGFLDMASGRYLWRNLRPTNKDVESKSS